MEISPVNESSIASQQEKLNDKIDNVSAKLNVIVDSLANAEIIPVGDDPEVIEPVQTLLSKISPIVPAKHESSTSHPTMLKLSGDEIKVICNQITELFNDLSSFRSEMNSINDQLIKLEEKHDKDILSIKKNCEDELNAVKILLKEEIDKLKERNNSLDQYLRSNNLVLHKFRIPKGIYSGTEFTHYVAETLNSLLPMLKTRLSVHNINITHPLRSNSRGQPLAS